MTIKQQLLDLGFSKINHVEFEIITKSSFSVIVETNYEYTVINDISIENMYDYMTIPKQNITIKDVKDLIRLFS